MEKLSDRQITDKIKFIEEYCGSSNAATGSKLDANANVSKKNIATLSAEINKFDNVQVNRALVAQKIETLFDKDLAIEYYRQLEQHEIYCHDETSLQPYCVSITMFPFLVSGLRGLGGESKAPKHLSSFCGSFVNLVFAVASQFAGAVATTEFLMYFDYFARKDYGENYLVTHTDIVKNSLQHVVYALNQPAAARGYQSVFWNISCFDENYFNAMFGNFYFLDGDQPKWESISNLQHFFLRWFNKERTRAVLTFPVVTCALLADKTEPKDKEFGKMLAKEMSEGNSFFIYMGDTVDSLSSCCRLRNEFDNNEFSYTLGAGGVATGSINVITINLNRLIQDKRDLATEIEKVQKYQVAYRALMQEYLDKEMLDVYSSGFISMDKQFLTLGVNGIVEAAEYLGINPGNNELYKDFLKDTLKVFYDKNKEAKKKYGFKFNTEFVPAENLGVKNAKWDKKDGYFVPRDCYNSYFYPVEDESINILDKFVLFGRDITRYLDGGSALHLNLGEYYDQEGFYNLLKIMATTGCNYLGTNVLVTICDNCEHIDKRTVQSCPRCGSTKVAYATRVIGYLKRIDNFSAERQKEAAKRKYHRTSDPSTEKWISSKSEIKYDGEPEADVKEVKEWTTYSDIHVALLSKTQSE